MNNTLTDQVLNRHDAVQLVEHLRTTLQDEQQGRKSFREWVKEDFKAEFINGEIVVHSPVKRRHWKANDLLSSLMSFYVRTKKLGEIGTEKVMIALTRNDYEPDLVFFSKEKAAKLADEQVLFPAPDFIVEILSKGTAKHDKTTKKADYALHGIREYWIIDPKQQSVEQYLLADKKATEYTAAKVHQLKDTIESPVIEGFKIPVAAIFDEAVNLDTFRKMM